MIEGFVNARYEPVISIPLQGPSGLAQEIEAVVDTGYNGYNLAAWAGGGVGADPSKRRVGDAGERQCRDI